MRVTRIFRVTRRGRMMASKASQLTIRKIRMPAMNTPGARIMRNLSLSSRRTSWSSGDRRDQSRVHCDFRLEKFGDGATGLRALHGRVKLGLVGVGNRGHQVKMALGDGKAFAHFLERNRAGRLELRSDHARGAELIGKGHGKAPGMS